MGSWFPTLFRRRQTPDRRPFLLEYRSAEWFIVGSVVVAIYSEIFLYAVIVPVFPFSLTVRAGVPEEDLQKWTSILLAVYAAFLLAGSPVAGWVADKTTTRRGPLLLSLITFATANLVLMLGRSTGALIAGRALQGFSAAAVWSIGLALLVDTVGVDRIGEAMGWVSLSMSLGVFSGPLLGGIVYEKAGYYAVFYMCIGVVLLDIILRLLIVEKRVAKQWLGEAVYQNQKPWASKSESGKDTSADAKARAAVSDAVVESKDEENPRDPPAADVTIGGSPPAGSVDPQPHEHKQSQIESSPRTEEYSASSSDQIDTSQSKQEAPTSSDASSKHSAATPASAPTHFSAIFTLLSSRRLLISLWSTTVASTIITSFDTIIPLRVATLFHWNSIGSGLIFLAIIIPSLISPLVGKLVDRFGSRLITTLTFAFLCPSLICLRFVTNDSIQHKVLLCALLACAGGGVSMLMVPVLVEITHCVESTQNKFPAQFGARGAFAQGYALMNMAYAVGTLVGPIWSGFVVAGAGWGTATWTLGLLAGVNVVPVFLMTGGWIGRRGWRDELLRPERAVTRKKVAAEAGQKDEERGSERV